MAECGKLARRAWRRASYRQTEIAHASAADGETSVLIQYLGPAISLLHRPHRERGAH